MEWNKEERELPLVQLTATMARANNFGKPHTPMIDILRLKKFRESWTIPCDIHGDVERIFFFSLPHSKL